MADEYKRIKVTKQTRYDIVEVGKEDETQGRTTVISPTKEAGSAKRVARGKSTTLGSPHSFQ